MINFISFFDKAITKIIISFFPRNNDITMFFYTVSMQKYPYTIMSFSIILFFVFAYLFIKKNKRKIILFHLFSSIFFTYSTVELIKQAVQRNRPFTIFLQENIYTCPNDYSFPSGHTAIAFCCAYILAYFDKKRQYLYYLLAFLIGLSRMYLYCHYTVDIVFGGFIGFFIAFLFTYIYKKGKV